MYETINENIHLPTDGDENGELHNWESPLTKGEEEITEDNWQEEVLKDDLKEEWETNDFTIGQNEWMAEQIVKQNKMLKERQRKIEAIIGVPTRKI